MARKDGGEPDRAFNKKAARELRKLMRFPENTDPFSRHVLLMAVALAKGEKYFMLEEEPLHCAGSMYQTLVWLYETRKALFEVTGSYFPAKDKPAP